MKNSLGQSSREHGFALPMALLLLVILSILAASYLSQSSTEVNLMGSNLRHTQALYKAECGINEVLSRLNASDSLTTYLEMPSEITDPGGGFYLVEQSGASDDDPDRHLIASDGVDNDGDTIVDEENESYPEILSELADAAVPWVKVHYLLDGSGDVVKRSGGKVVVITARGKLGTTQRTIEVQAVYEGIYGRNYAMFGHKKVEVKGDGTVTGNVASNRSVKISTMVYGDAFSATKVDHPEYVTGEVSEEEPQVVMDPVEAPAIPYGPPPTGAGVTFDPVSGKLEIDSNSDVTFPAGDYLFSEVLKKGEGRMAIGVGDVVNIYIQKKLRISKKGGFHNPNLAAANLNIFGVAGKSMKSIKLNQDNEAWFTLFAPGHKVELRGDGDKYGSFIGKEMKRSGKGNIVYDTALAEWVSFDVTSTSWRELHN